MQPVKGLRQELSIDCYDGSAYREDMTF